jgi:hypothetical protein
MKEAGRLVTEHRLQSLVEPLEAIVQVPAEITAHPVQNPFSATGVVQQTARRVINDACLYKAESVKKNDITIFDIFDLDTDVPVGKELENLSTTELIGMFSHWPFSNRAPMPGILLGGTGCPFQIFSGIMT